MSESLKHGYSFIDSVVYIVDSNSFIVISNYYPASFPSFWENLNELVAGGRMVSVREVFKELEGHRSRHLVAWIERNQTIFASPTEAEMSAVGQIFRVTHFQQLIGKKQRLKGSPVADPWLVAKGMVDGGCVVTEELPKPNAAKIPNVCDYFDVECTTVEGMLSQEGWRY